MLHPVLPPDPPPILEPLQIANPVLSVSDTKSTSGIKTRIRLNTGKSKHDKDLAQLPIAGETKSYPRSPTSLDSTADEVLVAETPSPPNPPETFPPEFSSGSASQSAALLGQSLEVGYPTQEVQTFNLAEKEDTEVDRRKDGETRGQGKTEVGGSEELQQRSPNPDSNNQEKQTSLDSPLSTSPTPRVTASPPPVSASNSQSVQNLIQFKSRNPTNKLSAPFTVEFYSQTQTPTPTPQVDTTNQPQAPATTPPAATPRIVEVTSDRQEYDEQRRIITAVGNVVVRFDGAVVDADRLQVNLDNLIAAGEGNVVLTRGDQVLRGQRFTYNFVQDSGEMLNGRGEIFVPSASTDFAFSSTNITAGGVPQRLPSDGITANQPLSSVSSPGGIDITVGAGQTEASNLPPPKAGGAVKRLRFEAQQIDFYPQGWQASNVRITNDPFSPPELELRADKVTSTRESPLVDRIQTRGQRLVLDQTISLPIPVNERTIDRRERDVTPFIVSPGYDGEDRGGFYVERGFQVIDTEQTRWTITPQLFVQRAIEGTDNLSGIFGVRTRINSVLSPRTVIQGTGELTSFDFDNVEDSFRANLGLRQILGDRLPHLLNLQYNYRDRLYNGSLGFQDVQSSFGGLITSPVIPLGKSGINLSYQASAQYIDANTDRLDLLEPVRENNRISLGRLQASADLSTGFLLWQGKPLPPTSSEGLRYTATPVVPYLQAIAGVTGTSSYYSNGDNQSTLTGRIGLLGQIGNFSRPFFDYTAFNISYSQALNNGLSPFLFDRSVDNKILTAGITQQIYGPLRLGFQTSINLDTGKETSTDYIVEYSRRTYGITLRYNPVLELGAVSFRISDFNWSGGADPFSEIKPVVGGVQQNY